MDKGLEPSVAIILINYNSSTDTIECIDSLHKCLYSNYKIFVVDNNSCTEEKLLLKEIENKAKVFYLDSNIGFAGGNNIAIREAIKEKFNYIMLLNNDTVVEKHFLNYMIETAQSEKQIGVVGGKILYYDSMDYIWYNGGEINKFKGNVKHYFNNLRDNKTQTEFIECDFITGCLQLIKTEVIQRVGLLDEDYFLYYEDADYCSKVTINGWKLIVDSRAKIYHKVSRSTGENSENYLYYFSRNRLMFIRGNIDKKYKVIAYAYTGLSLLYKVIKYKSKSVLYGMIDFAKNKKGIRG